MPALRPPGRRGRREGRTPFAPVLLANLLPLAGVLWLEWQPGTLVVVYGLELALLLLLAGGKALFAQRPPPSERGGVVSVSEEPLTEKRGSVRVHDSLPPIYPRNVPFALRVTFGLVLYGSFFGVVALSIVRTDAELAGPAVLASVGALVVGQLVETKRQYFDRRVYERVSPYAVVEAPARQLFVLLFAFAVLGLSLGSMGALVLVVGLKLLVEWSTFRTEREDADADPFVDRFAAWFAGPAEAVGSPDPVRAPETEPTARIRPARNALRLEGVLLALSTTVFLLPFFGVLWLFVVLVVASWLDSVLVFWLGVVASVLLLLVAVGIQVAKHVLEYATLEYQRRGDYLVAYDRLLEEPQWAETVYGLRNVAVVPDRFTDRLLGTRTIRVTTGIRSTETERRLGPVDDPDRLVEVFELPLATTDLEPIDRPLAFGAGMLTVGIVLVAAALLVVPDGSMDARFDWVVLSLFALLIPRKLWTMACAASE